MHKCVVIAVLAVMVMAARAGEILDGVAAIVNDKVITYSEVREYVQPVVQQLRHSYNGSNLVERVRAAQMDALNNLIERALIIQEFKAKGYSIPETVIDEQFNDVIASDFGGDRAAFIKTLQAQNMTVSQYRDQLRDRVIVQAMRNNKTQKEVVVSPYKIEKYYQEHTEDYKVEDQIKLRMIFIKKAPAEEAKTLTPQNSEASTNESSTVTNNTEQTGDVTTNASPETKTEGETPPAVSTNTAAVEPHSIASTNESSVATNGAEQAEQVTTNAPPEAKTEGEIPPAASTNTVAVEPPPPPPVDPRRKLADEIVAKLNAGDSFDSLAKLYSEGKEAKEGGDWGWIGKDVLRKELNEIAFTLKRGQHSGVIDTAEGFYILQVDDVKPTHVTPLAEARDQIEKILLQQQRAKMQENWVKDLRAKAYIRLF